MTTSALIVGSGFERLGLNVVTRSRVSSRCKARSVVP